MQKPQQTQSARSKKTSGGMAEAVGKFLVFHHSTNGTGQQPWSDRLQPRHVAIGVTTAGFHWFPVL
ncbi:MAG: hypothetical protein BM485_01785 [Desulfobulbaceae bacterium DB1]|nr:MAG: hypothetical protein BM485_01785 [Desulfobulbaceae bacterium DB1]